jgi:hypothetical protein
MSNWNHLLCEQCYAYMEPGKKPVKVPPAHRDGPQPCCWCGKETNSGIYYRRDPLGSPCLGEGPVHAT